MAEKINIDSIESKIKSELKDFQWETVKRIDSLYREGRTRILVADEVGLGKTLVAKGVIAKFTRQRIEQGDNLIKVLYICSNSSIVDQNLNHLIIEDDNENIAVDSSDTSRLSMQHINISMQKYCGNDEELKIQLIPLTPETSFHHEHSQGTISERALMFTILKEIGMFKDEYESELARIFINKYDIDVKKEAGWWDATNHWQCMVDKLNENSKNKYIDDIANDILFYSSENYLNGPRDKNQFFTSNILAELKALCEKIRIEKKVNKAVCKKRISKFRKIFAKISLEYLDPDLIILDEFQRFNTLINCHDNKEMCELINKFFKSGTDIVPTLLLSATPYKLYSTIDEISHSEPNAHYTEFFDLIKFLKNNDEEFEEFKTLWEDYSIKLNKFIKSEIDKETFVNAKNIVESELSKNICRTERLSEDLGDIFEEINEKQYVTVSKEDIQSYRDAQILLNSTLSDVNVPIDYIKSSPYIMSFMKKKNYKLKRDIENYFKKHINDIDKIEKHTLWLDKTKIDDYEEISFNNGRLNYLIDDVLKDNASNLLWIPPSMPYYEQTGVFRDCKDYSKSLVFSSWDMVPGMVSSLVSYEVERQTIGQAIDKNYKYGKERWEKEMFCSQCYGMPITNFLFTLIYPSISLINSYNPIDCLNRNLSLEDIENEIKQNIKSNLDDKYNSGISEDYRWYYLAPLLLDDENHVLDWFEKVKSSDYFNHYENIKNEYDDIKSGEDTLGRPPSGLVDFLCDLAISSPVICAYRTYKKELPKNSSSDSLILPVYKLGNKFIDFMTTRLSMSVLKLTFENFSKEKYWKYILKYSKLGNLQAVFDEYVYLLSNDEKSNDKKRIEKINDKLISSLDFQNSDYDIDTFDKFKSRINKEKPKKFSMRTHFATSFAQGSKDNNASVENNNSSSEKLLMNAFNSPFKPFILTSTSKGQEGLNFHKYCKQIVHWNLPSNPIDLEQREGRVNRFEGLVIRQNVAKRYGHNGVFNENIWKELFIKARDSEKTGKCSDLIPHWGLKESKDMIKIKRIVPIYPFSSDESKYHKLNEILSLYRLTLGQISQDNLIKLISNSKIDKNNLDELFINLSPYYQK